jgi:hypothetical protein
MGFHIIHLNTWTETPTIEITCCHYFARYHYDIMGVNTKQKPVGTTVNTQTTFSYGKWEQQLPNLQECSKKLSIKFMY